MDLDNSRKKNCDYESMDGALYEIPQQTYENFRAEDTDKQGKPPY